MIEGKTAASYKECDSTTDLEAADRVRRALARGRIDHAKREIALVRRRNEMKPEEAIATAKRAMEELLLEFIIFKNDLQLKSDKLQEKNQKLDELYRARQLQADKQDAILQKLLSKEGRAQFESSRGSPGVRSLMSLARFS